ncbi:MAG: nucleotidyl transferase AbiEii/AbiGii toxin family protein [Anaerolineales bacterium]|nr:nucleotidyl transferase AbiEii/AbiGii toxin family protein [Anaerolineales bacterium]
MIAFERFMARLDGRWVLKGGYALQLRTESARTTQDIDLLAQRISAEEITETLLEILHQDMGDPIPAQLDQIPTGWRPKFNQFSKNLDLPFSKFDEAVQAAQRFINPVLSGTANGIWDPVGWKWKSKLANQVDID